MQKRKGRYRNGVWDDRYTGICKSVCRHISSNGLISFAKAHGALENNAGIMQPKGANCTFNVPLRHKMYAKKFVNLHLRPTENQGKYERSSRASWKQVIVAILGFQ